MMLVEETQVGTADLPVAAFKAHLRMGSGFGDDSLQDGVLESFLRAAVSAIEARTGKVLLARNFTLRLEDWRSSGGQVLPVAPVQEVTSLTLVDHLGEETPVAPSVYRLVPDTTAPEVRAVGGVLPLVPREGSVLIAFRAGYGEAWDAVPDDLAQAVFLLGAHYYEYRHDTGLRGGCMPFGVTSLIERYRPMRLGLGAGQ